MSFRFSTKKTIQAAGVLLRLARQHRMSYLRLLKLLYIADRENLRCSRRPILGMRAVAMKNGPLHSEVFNFIKGEHMKARTWSQYIRREGFEVVLARDPDISELSAAEVRVLTGTFQGHANMDDWELVEVAHTFPEWDKNYPDKSADTSRTIPFEDLIDAVGLAREKAEILEDAREDNYIDQLVASARRR